MNFSFNQNNFQSSFIFLMKKHSSYFDQQQKKFLIVSKHT